MLCARECPKPVNSTVSYSLNVRGNGSATKSEFLCDFIWTDKAREELKSDLLDRMKKRQKAFVRLTYFAYMNDRY